MNQWIRPILEISIILPGAFLAYLLTKPTASSNSWKFILGTGSLLTILTGLCGFLCWHFRMSTPLILLLMLIPLSIFYWKSTQMPFWQCISILLAISASFSCIFSFCRAVDAVMTANTPVRHLELWFRIPTGIILHLLCWLFVLLTWYPIRHSLRPLIKAKYFTKVWYILWIFPSIFIGLNLFIIPKQKSILYRGRILEAYFVFSLFFLIVLISFYGMFLMLANSLGKRNLLQAQNHFLSMQQKRYKSLQSSIEEARQARHDMRHHFQQLMTMAEQEEYEELKSYLQEVTQRIPNTNLHFCDNRAADNVIGYYYAMAKNEEIPLQLHLDLPEKLPVNEIDLCLILSNLLENALEASKKAKKNNQHICLKAYLHSYRLLLIQIENNYEGNIFKSVHGFQSSKRNGVGIGTQSIRRIAEKNGGSCKFSHENGLFTAKILLRCESESSSFFENT